MMKPVLTNPVMPKSLLSSLKNLASTTATTISIMRTTMDTTTATARLVGQARTGSVGMNLEWVPTRIARTSGS